MDLYRFVQIFGAGRWLGDELVRTVAIVQLLPAGRTTPNPTLPVGYVPPPANTPASGQPGVLQPWWARPIIEMRVRNGTTPGPLQLAPGPAVRVEVPPLALEWHAMFTGGSLPAASSIASRLTFRASMVEALWAFIEAAQGEWRATELYHQIETTEKAAASYRLGTTFAGVAGDLALGFRILTHRQTLLGRSSGRRGDLYGRRQGNYHGVEAKGRGPISPHGTRRNVSNVAFDNAKAQAGSFAADRRWHQYPPGADHWAITTIASTSDPFEIVLDDPQEDSGYDGPPPPPSDGDFPQDDPDERLLQGFYQVAEDIQQLVDATTSSESDRFESTLDGRYRGAFIPGTAIWVGVMSAVVEARREQRLVSLVNDLEADPRVLGPASYATMGLAIARALVAPSS